MEFYNFMRDSLAWMASIACLFPVTVPMLYFAYRLREGRVDEDDVNRMDNDELWKRAGLAGLALLAITAVFLFADLVLASWAGAPAGVIHFVIFLGYVPAVAFAITYLFGYEDFFAGLGIFTLFLGLPIAILLIVNWLLGVWNPVLRIFYSWLKVVS